MEYLIRNVVIPIDEITQANEPALLKERAARLAHVSLNDIRDLRIIRESVDSRKKHHITMVYTLLVRLDGRIKEGRDILIYKPEAAAPQPGGTPTVRPVIVGAGPCGLFCAYTLVENGFSPIVIERGQEVEKRSECVQRFWRDGILNTETNVQFGEGGAGTFSDGKLTTRINDPRSSGVLEAFVRFGAPPDIQYKAKAHIGTDILRDVVRNMREYLKSRGCTFYFSTRMENLELRDGRVHGVTLADGTVIESQAVVLAIGHSARDTFEKLHGQGVEMKQKAFSVGVRIEHLQEAINRAQYGDVRHFKLEAADYQLFEHLQDRTAYTFCMCPGGVVVAAASEENTIVTNGMSYRARNGTNANAAYVVSVGPNDFSGNHPLAGIAYQRRLEQRCYQEGMRYAAPVQRLGDFLNHTPSSSAGRIKPSYTGEVIYTDLHHILPEPVANGIKASVSAFDRKLKGFLDPDAIMTAAETRTSSPVRIVRGEDLQSVSTAGLFPAGEGAGYAGGIMSAAVDGIRVAEQIIKDYSR